MRWRVAEVGRGGTERVGGGGLVGGFVPLMDGGMRWRRVLVNGEGGGSRHGGGRRRLHREARGPVQGA